MVRYPPSPTAAALKGDAMSRRKSSDADAIKFLILIIAALAVGLVWLFNKLGERQQRRHDSERDM